MNMDTYAAYTTINIIQLHMSIWIMDIHNLILNSHNSIMDSIHNLIIVVIHWIHITINSLQNNLPDRFQGNETASVKQNNCICWSERPAISSGCCKFSLPKYWSQPRFKVQNSLVI